MIKIEKEKILKNLCFTKLVYNRINRKLKLNLNQKKIEEFVCKIISESRLSNFKKIGKNMYISNKENDVRVTVNLNSNRVITMDVLSKLNNRKIKRT